jgi:hypothetical protein
MSPLRRIAPWLLPWVVVRLFVPVGFMLAPSGHGLGIALCPGHAPLPMPGGAQVGHAHHAGMDHASGSGHHDSGPSACPFALAGGTAGCTPSELIGSLPRLANDAACFYPRPSWFSPAVLIDRIRGPPLA